MAVAEAGGFNAAARKLGMSAPSVTRLVSALETRVGTALLTRTTRQVALTEAGARLFADGARILEAVTAAEASAAGAHEAPKGLLSVTAPVKFGQLYIAPILRDYLDFYPDVAGQTLFVDRVVNLIEEGMDVAVRIGELPDSTLTAVRVGQVRRVVVASPAYLARAGIPNAPEDLRNHRIIGASNVSPSLKWEFTSGERSRVVSVDVRFRANTVDTALDAVLDGWGVTRTLSYQVAAALERGALVELLPGQDSTLVPIHLVHAEGQLRAAKIRAFIDLARTRLRAQAARWTASAAAAPSDQTP